MNQCFPSDHRLKSRSEFRRVMSKGKRRFTKHFIIYALETERQTSRLGITVSRKVGNAVVRNRVKRCVRDVFRTRLQEILAPTDLVVIAKHGATTSPSTSKRLQHYRKELISVELHEGIPNSHKMGK